MSHAVVNFKLYLITNSLNKVVIHTYLNITVLKLRGQEILFGSSEARTFLVFVLMFNNVTAYSTARTKSVAQFITR